MKEPSPYSKFGHSGVARCSVKIFVMVEMFITCVAQYEGHLWLLSTWNVPSVTKNYIFHFIKFK